VVVLTAFEDPKLLSTRIPTFPEDFVYLVKQRIENLDEVVDACELARAYAVGEAEPPNSSDRFPLSRSQAEMLRLVASGLSNRAIAEQLSLGEDSVAKSINRLAKKLLPARGEDTNVRVSLTQIYFDMMGFQREG
jgi:DNA-binding NarL/FixJ family response regulator